MKRSTMSMMILGIMLMISSMGWSQISVMTEDFESASIPSGWSQSTTAEPTVWNVGSTGVVNLSEAYSGSNYAYLATSTSQGSVQLISPLVDISTLTLPELSFAMVQPSYSGGLHDTLKVYVRTSTTATWQQAAVYTEAVENWSEMHISLSDYLSMQTNIQVAFEYTYGAGKGIGIDAFVIGNESVCAQPSVLTAYRISHESAELMWASSEASISYHLKVSTTSMSDLTQSADVMDTVIYYKPFTVNGLSANTTYYFYVQSNCGDNDISEWSEEGSFSTLCAPINLPYTEGFESYGNGTGTYPSCWREITRITGDWTANTSSTAAYYPYCYSTTKHNGTASLRLYGYYYFASSYSSARITSQIAVTPMISATSITECQVSFWMYSANVKFSLSVGLMTDPSDESTFEEIAVVNSSQSNSWEEFIVPFTTSENLGKYVAFRIDGGNTDNLTETIFIDDVEIDYIPACPKPSLVRTPVLSSDNVQVTWSSGVTNSNYRVMLTSSSVTPDTVTVAVYDTIVSTEQVAFTGLEPQTTYYIYVQNQCGTDGNSRWSNEATFTTTCSPVTEFPFVEDFETYTTGSTSGLTNKFPTCWSRTQNYSTTTGYPYISTSTTYLDGYGLYFYSSATSYNVASTPEMGVNDIRELKIDFTMGVATSGYQMEVGVMTNPNDINTFVAVDTIIPNAIGSIQHYTVYFSNYTGDGKFISFRSDRSATNTVYIDNINISYIGNCFPPMGLSSQVTSTSANLSWFALPSNSYRVKVSSIELPYPNISTANVFDGVVNTNQLSLSNLNGGSHYFVYLANNCGSDSLEWYSDGFRTDCGSITTLPYYEDFNDLKTSTVYNCWTKVYGSKDLNVITPNSSNCGYDNSMSYKFMGNEVMVATPAIASEISNLEVSFQLAQSASTAGTMIVGVLSDVNDSTTFEPIDTFSYSVYKAFSYETISTENVTMRGSNCRIAFLHKTTSSAAYFWLDNVSISALPTCKRVTNLVATDILDDYVSLSWDSVGTVVGYQLSAVIPGQEVSAGIIVNSNQASATINGLSAMTDYEIYARVICSAGDTSAWSAFPLSLTTTEVAATLPYANGFEDNDENDLWTLSNGLAKNGWSIGNAIQNTGVKSLYISNDGGDTYAYTAASSTADRSHVYAYRTLDLPAGQVEITFDWRANGRTTYDYMVAFLVPTTIDIYEGDKYVSGMVYPFSSYIFSATTVKDGWIMLGESKLNLQNSWQSFDEVVTITNPGGYRLVFYWANYYQTAGAVNSPAAIDNINVSALTCGSPTIDEIVTTDSSAVIKWYVFNNANRWNLKVSNVELDMDSLDVVTANIYDGEVSSSTQTIQDLESNTPYYVYVRALCSATDTSTWSSSVFQTECAVIRNLPFKENFEGYGTGTTANHPCWTEVQSNGNYPYLNASYNHTDLGSASMYFYTSSTACVNNMIASPYIEADLNTLELTFYTYTTNVSYKIEVGVLSNLSDPNSFVTVATIFPNEKSVWEKQTIDFSSYTGNGHYLAFHTGFGSTNYMYIDDIELIENRSCKRPYDVMATRLKETEARVSWTSDNELCLYNIKLSTTPIDPQTQTADVFEVSGIQDSYVDATDLTAGTTYYAYIQADCGDSIGSLWSEALEFNTVCTPLQVPYTEYFNSVPAGLDVTAPCWFSYVEKIGNPPSGAAYTYRPYTYEGVYYGTDKISYKLYAYYSSTTTSGVTTVNASKSFAVLPKFVADLSSLQIKFNHYSSAASTPLILGALSDPTDASSFEVIDTVYLSGWSQSTIALDKYTGSNRHLAFMVDGVSAQKPYTAYIDQIEVDSIRRCQPPVNLNYSALSDESVTLNWESITPFDSIYNIQVTTYDAGYNSYLVDNVTDFVADTIITGNQVTITGLEPNTTYYYYVRAVCDSTFSERFPRSMSFTTSCSPISLPFFEGFESSDFLYDCWRRERSVQSGTTTNTWVRYSTATTSTYVKEGHGSLQLQDMTAGNKTNLVLPMLNIDTANAYVLKFDLYRSATNKVNEGVKVWLNTSPDTIGGTEFMYIHRYYAATPTETASGWYEYMDTIPVSGNYYIILEGISDYGTATYMDNISIAHKNGCERLLAPVIDSYSKDSICFSWTADSSSVVEVSVAPSSVSQSDLIPISIAPGTMNYKVGGLLPNTSYTVYVRNACTSGIPSVWNGTEITTLQMPTTIPFFESFESDSLNGCWRLIGGNINSFMIGDATSADGSNSLYITDDGVNNEYTITSLSYAFAYRTLVLDRGAYDLSYLWKADGQASYDFGRVFLAPGSFVPNAGANNGITNITTTPAGWISIGDALLGESDWQSEEQIVEVPDSGSYQLLFYWYNNASTGAQPALAVDSISMVYRECYDPFDLKVSHIMSNNAIISVVSDASRFEIKVDTLSHPLISIDSTAVLIDTTTTTFQSQINGLQPETNYHYWFRAYCDNDTSSWVYGGTFKTGCAAILVDDYHSYSEDFDSYDAGTGKRPDCWSYYSSYTPATYPYVNASWGNNSTKGLYMYISGTDSYSYMATPELNTDMTKLQVNFFSRSTTTNNILLVGVMTDPTDYSTFEEVARVPANSVWTESSLSFSEYEGTGKYVAFAVDQSISNLTGNFAFDDVVISYMGDCSYPVMLTTDSIGSDKAVISFMTNNHNNQWRLLLLPSVASYADTALAIVDTIVTTNPVLIENLQSSTTYKIAMASICGVGDTTDWSSLLTFTTNCSEYSLPFNQDFTSFLPDCWSRYTGLLSGVLDGTVSLATTTSGWLANTTNNGLNGAHTKLNIYGTSAKYWLVTPVIDLTYSSNLTFDMALTDYGNANAIEDPTLQEDDKFMVLVSTDQGNSWNAANSTVWNNTGDGDYVYNQIPNTATTVSINLSSYVGEQIRVAFYGESTVSGGDNDLHLDNIRINGMNSYTYSESICEGYNYNNYGFSINRDSLTVANSPYTFERIGLSSEGNDSLVTLTLTINPNAVETIDATICEGDIYSANGFNETVEGQYRRNLLSTTGCDSIVLLNLTVIPTVVNSTDLSICVSELPYSWRTMSLTQAGTYNDTLQSANGCDSVIQLVLTVLPEYHVTDMKSISVEDLPYTYLDTVFTETTPLNQELIYVFNRKTVDGCDSVVTLTLSILSVGSIDVTSDVFELYPNPAKRNQEVTLNASFAATELEGIVVEVFNSVGECIKTYRPSEFPLHFSGFDAAGVYVVRVTTSNQRVVYGKLVIR